MRKKVRKQEDKLAINSLEDLAFASLEQNKHIEIKQKRKVIEELLADIQQKKPLLWSEYGVEKWLREKLES